MEKFVSRYQKHENIAILMLNRPRGTLAPLNRAKNFKKGVNMHMDGISI